MSLVRTFDMVSLTKLTTKSAVPSLEMVRLRADLPDCNGNDLVVFALFFVVTFIVIILILATLRLFCEWASYPR